MTWADADQYREDMLRRGVQIAALLPVLAFVAFALLHAVPGEADALIVASNPDATTAEVERIRSLRGLDRSVVERFGCWLIGQTDTVCAWWPGGHGLLRGDLGWSRTHNRPVADLIGERLLRTLGLMLPAFLLAAVLALGLGGWAAQRRGQWPDRLVSGLAFVGLATPLHWLALLAVLGVGVDLGWLPTSGIEDPTDPGVGSRIRHAILPVLVTTIYFASRWTRHARAAAADALGAPFTTALRARGASEARVTARALRSALVPVLTVIGHSLPVLFSGAIVIERVFVYPGMGILLLDAVYADDHLVAIVVLLGYAAATLVGALLTDAVLLLLDPRLRAGGAKGGLR